MYKFDIDNMAGQIRAARAKANLSRDELADKAGCSSQSIKNYENGTSVPSLSTAADLANALGVSIEYLVED